MTTEIIEKEELDRAAFLLEEDEVVAFATETVYGLGARAFSVEAVKKIFVAKGRPADNPLIVHIADFEQLREVAVVDERRLKVLKEVWPGPLTVILPKNEAVNEVVCAGLKTVAVRMPNHEVALRLIKQVGPLAAPSANISGRPSGTLFADVFEDFNGKIAGIVKDDGGNFGLESSVIDWSDEEEVVLLRPGSYLVEELQKHFHDLKMGFDEKVEVVKSPGMKYRHYSPQGRVVIFYDDGKMSDYLKKAQGEGLMMKVLLADKNIFANLRECDREGVKLILIKAIEEKGLGLAIMNRLKKAASEIIV